MSFARSRTYMSVSVVVVAVLFLTLTGCEQRPPIADAPISVGIDNGQLKIAMCRNIDVEDVSAASRSGSGNWTDFFHAIGSLSVSAGDAYTLDELSSVLSATLNEEPSTEPGTEFDILIKASDPANNLLGNLQIVDELGEGTWLRGDGTVGPEACN